MFRVVTKDAERGMLRGGQPNQLRADWACDRLPATMLFGHDHDSRDARPFRARQREQMKPVLKQSERSETSGQQFSPNLPLGSRARSVFIAHRRRSMDGRAHDFSTSQIGTGLAVSSTNVQSRAIARWHLHLGPRHAMQD